MTKTEKEKMAELSEKALEVVDLLNDIQQDLEELGRVRDTGRIRKAKDLAYEFAEKWER